MSPAFFANDTRWSVTPPALLRIELASVLTQTASFGRFSEYVWIREATDLAMASRASSTSASFLTN